jgi:hypothetical protein
MDVQSFPRVRRGEIEAIGMGSAIGLWSLKTERSLDEVLTPEFFASFAHQRGMSEHDRILAVCGIGTGAPQYVDLVVERVVAPVRGNPDARIAEVKAAVHVRVLRLEAPSPARSRAA